MTNVDIKSQRRIFGDGGSTQYTNESRFRFSEEITLITSNEYYIFTSVTPKYKYTDQQACIAPQNHIDSQSK
jgi:flagellar basal body rod protein FlgG